MTKRELLKRLEAGLQGLSDAEKRKSLDYYAEMIDDRVEDGMTEEEAVAALGDPEELIRAARLDAPLTALIAARVKPRHRLRWWEIVCIVLGSVVWLPLLLVFLVCLLTVYLTVWSVIAAIFATLLALGVAAIGCLAGAAALLPLSKPLTAALFIGSALILAGLTLLCSVAAVWISRMLIRLTGRFMRWVKSLFIRKEASI